MRDLLGRHRLTIAAAALAALCASIATAGAAGLITGRQIKDGTISSRDLSKAVRAQLAKAGRPGPAGTPGAAGPAGAPGTARAYGLITGVGLGRKLVAERSKGITDVTTPSPALGVYCITLDPALGIDVKTVAPVVSVDRREALSYGYADNVFEAYTALNAKDCAATQIEVQTTVGSPPTLQDIPFTILVP